MAGEQDISSIGLDISSFSEAKKAQLKEFLLLFNQLDKYDKRIFNPLLGDGLTKLNLSIQETNRLLDVISLKLSNLNTNFAIHADQVEQSFSRTATRVRTVSAAIDDVSASQKKLVINSYAGKTALEGIGKSLTGLLTNLRYVAYILPGIGIAGIFNIAGEAISNALEGLGLFNESLTKTIDHQIDLNKGIEDEIKLYKELYELRQKITAAAEGGRVTDKDILAFDEARGYEQLRILTEKQKINELEIAKSTANVIAKGQSPESLKDDLDRRYKVLLNYSERIGKIDEELNRLQSPTKVGDDRKAIQGRRGIVQQGRIIEGVNNPDKETLKKLKESLEEKKRAETDSFNFDKDLLDKYIVAQNEYFTLRAALAKFNSDQQRSITVENIRAEVSTDLKAQQDILNNDKKFYDERKQAIIRQFEDEKKANEATRISVTGTTDNPNVSATAAEKANAITKQASEDKQAQIKKNAELEKNDVEFYQRKLKALTDINIDQIKAESDKNQKIANNENKSLAERLQAYLDYVKNENDISSYQEALELQRGAAKFGGKTSLTPDESHAIEAKDAKRKEDIIADSEKRIYDIIYTSQEKLLNEAKAQNDREDQIDLTGHINALKKINQEYIDRKISLKNYRKEKAAIELQYERSDLDQQIVNDRIGLQRLKIVYLEKIQLELDYREELLKVAEAGGNKQAIADAKAAVKAAKDAVDKALKEIHDQEDKLHKDELNREKKTEPAEKKDTKASTEALRALQRINDDIRRLYDERIEAQIQFIEKKEALIDREYGYEKDAIDQSSLSLKDKQALTIQIQEQQQVLDENATREEISLKIKKFEFDKKIALANAAIGIASAIIKDGITSPKAIADIVIGAAEIGVILAEQAPTFGEGVEDFEGGWATTGEKGPEAIKEPGKKVRIVTKETFSYLKPGTDVIPLTKVHPEFGESVAVDDGWEQTRYLAKQMKKNNREIKNIFKPTIVINGDFERRKNEILGR